MTNPNKHIEEFLTYYFKFEIPPEYAVLLKGKWGVGKTWFINKTLKSFEENKGKYLYVSLYGINSYEEIEGEFFKQLHPLLSSRSMALAGKIAKGLLKTTIHVDIDRDGKADGNVSSQIPDINLPDYLTKTEGFVLVFDDLERCSISISNILGYINHFVEHQGYKVIILANEEEILDKEKNDKDNETNNYIKIKEKLIGKTFEIEPDLNSALQHFINEIECEKVKEMCNLNVDLIQDLYESSDYKNLRHLKQALWDFERLYQYLSDAVKDKKELVIQLFKLYLCYSFEIKGGSISPSDVKALDFSYYGALNKDEQNKTESAYERLSKKYKNVEFYDLLLEESTWVDILDKGFINRLAIEESLLKSKYFQDESTQPWIKLWHYIDLTDDEFDSYFQSVKESFEKKEYDEIGIIKHIVGLFLRFSEVKLYKKTKEDILKYSKEYIDYLKMNGCLAKGRIILEDDEYDDSWGGLVFCGRELDEFKEFCGYTKIKENEEITESHPNAGKELLNFIESDTIKFRRYITLCNHEDSLYYNIPILQYIKPSEFVSSFMKVSPDDKRTIIKALNNRYTYGSGLRITLKPELEWLKTINELLTNEQQSLEGKISGYQLKRLIDSYLSEAIESLSK